MKERKRAAAVSILSNLCLILVKIGVGTWIRSAAVISEALHSGVDLLASVAAYASIREADKPPDSEHPYGHGKFENLAGIFEALLIMIAALFIFYEAIDHLISRQMITMTEPGIAVMGLSAGVNFFISGYLFRKAKASGSVALDADAWHLRTDVYSSLGIMLGLVAVQVSGQKIIDPLIAIVVGLVILTAGLRLVRKCMTGLMDVSLPEEEEKKIREVIQAYRTEFVGFHDLRTRKGGGTRYIDFHLVLCRENTVRSAHDLCDRMEEDLKKGYPDAQILIHTEPCDNHSPCERDCPLRESAQSNFER